MPSLSDKVAFNTLVQIAAKIITVSLTLFTTIILTGYLGKEGFGNYIYIITLVVMFGAIADWGTVTIGVRESAKETKNQGRALANILVLRLGLSFFAGLLMIIFSFFLGFQRAMLIGSLILLANSLKASFGIVFQTKLKMEKLAMADIIIGVLILFLSWLAVERGLGLVELILAFLIATIVGVIIAGFFAFKTTSFDFSLDRPFITRLAKESLPMGAILLMFTADNKIDTVMLGILKGSGSVGIYGIAYRVYDVLILGAAYLMNVLLPILSQYHQDKIKLRTIYQRTFDVLLLIGVGAGVLAYFASPLIVRVLTQQRFADFFDSVLVLRLLIPAMVLAYFNHLTGYTIVALGKQRPYFLVALSALIFNLSANLILIPRFSYFGAATVTILTEALVLLITTIFVFRILKFLPSLISFPKTAVQLIKQKGKIF